MFNCLCQCACCSTAGPPYPAGTFPVIRPTPIEPKEPAAPVADLSADATQADVIAAYNAMLASLRRAGYLKSL